MTRHRRDIPEIEKDIPLPETGSSSKYPWAQMQIGDSVLLKMPRTSVAGMISKAGRKYGVRFTSRNVDGGVRVWRIK